MLEKITEGIFNKIVHYNSKQNLEAIPHSDLFEKEVQSEFGIDKADLKKIIGILKDSHKIFTFEITKEDKDKEIKRVEGYVETDIKTIRKLKNYFQYVLMDEYEKQYNRRLLVHQIQKDIYSRPNHFKNTPIGQIANKAIMLEEYENLLIKDFTEYADSYKAKKLHELMQSTDAQLTDKMLQEEKGIKQNKASIHQRAVDSALYTDFSSDKARQSLNKILQIYGVEFFFRINLRKYNFDLLKQIIDSGEINRRGDLMILKKMLQKVKTNASADPKLKEYSDNIFKLERSISRQMLHST